MKPPSISVALAVYNEAANIARCLKSVHSWVNEIIIYDARSTDTTVAIAKTYSKVKIISGPNHPMFHLNKQAAINHCNSDWILQLDADEVVTPALKKEILSTIRQPALNYDGFWVNRHNYFLGRFLTKGGAYPDPTIRLYRHQKARLPCKSIHEQAQVDGPVGHLKSSLRHFSDPTYSRYLERNNRYTTHLAADLATASITPSLSNFISYFFVKPILAFASVYLRHRGYQDGFAGFVWAFSSALRFPQAYIKLYEANLKRRT